MSELKTTGLFVGAAALSLGLAWAFRPSAVLSEVELADEKRGSVIFPDLDTAKATSFRISRFNEDLATLSRIELARDKTTNLWTLPSADSYPADSAEQVSKAMTPLVDLIVLSTASTDRGDHAEYGVVEPNEEDLTVSASGVGMQVSVGGAGNEVLASLIVGKKVEGMENQHYVRVPTEDAVYVVEIDSEVFSTDLAKWIKGEILNVRNFDIEFVGLRDYAILPTERGYGLSPNFDADVEFKDNKWQLTRFLDRTQEGAEPTVQLPDGKSLGESALNDLRNSVQNLKIINVRRKPLGLAADLKVEKSLEENKESIKSLQDQGFFPQSGEMYAAGGELLVGTKDGVRYLLRFGNSRVSTSALQTASEDKAEDPASKSDDGDEGVSRYLLVTAKLDESKFPAPELKIVPETIEEMLAQEAAEKAKAGGADSSGTQPTPSETETPAARETQAPQDATAEEPQAAPAQAESDSESPVATQDQTDEPSPSADPPASSDDQSGLYLPQNDNPQSDRPAMRFVKTASAQEEAQEQTEPTADSAKASNEVQADQPPAEAQTEQKTEQETELTPSREETQEELKERLEFLQETIRKENQRLIDARNEQLSAAKKKVDELNARFADWYYVVSDSVYKKLKIDREKLFPDANAAKASPVPTGPSSFQLPVE